MIVPGQGQLPRQGTVFMIFTRDWAGSGVLLEAVVRRYLNNNSLTADITRLDPESHPALGDRVSVIEEPLILCCEAGRVIGCLTGKRSIAEIGSWLSAVLVPKANQ